MEWFTSKEISIHPPFNGVRRTAMRWSKRQNWQYRTRKGQGGGKEYHISSLPKETQRALKISMTKRAQSEQQKAKGNSTRVAGQQAALAESSAEHNRSIQRLKAINDLSTKEQLRVQARTEVLKEWGVYAKSYGSHNAAIGIFVENFNNKTVNVSDTARTFIPKISKTTLNRWNSAYMKAGPAGLAASYKPVRRSLVDEQPEIRDFVEGVIAKSPHTRATNMLRLLYGQFDGRDDIRLPGKRVLMDWMRKWKEKNHRLFMSVANPDAFKNKYMVAGGSASEYVTRLNQLWEMDSSPADIMCTDGRFTIISCIDVYSRFAVFLVRKTSDSYGVALTARKAILALGTDGHGEQKIRVDNGRDYASKNFQQVADSLGIQLVSTDPYAGEQKPFVERIFRTFQHGMLEQLPGYVGHNVAERQAIKAQHSFADRLKRKAGSREAVEVSMSSDELQAFCDKWLSNEYHIRPHSSLCGRSPLEMVDSWPEPVRRIDDERVLDLLLAPVPGQSGSRVVQKKGIKLEGYWYIAPEMGGIVGDPVKVRYDSSDMGCIYLFDLDGGFICIGQNPELTGISRQEITQLMKVAQKEAVQDAKKALKAAGRKINPRDVIEKYLDRRRRELESSRENVTQLPRASHDHITACIDGAKAALNASGQDFLRAEKEANTRPDPEVMSQYMADANASVRNKQTGNQKAETGYDRMRRWINMHDREQSGETLSEIEAQWKERHEKTDEWQGHKMVLDDFGKVAFGL